MTIGVAQVVIGDIGGGTATSKGLAITASAGSVLYAPGTWAVAVSSHTASVSDGTAYTAISAVVTDATNQQEIRDFYRENVAAASYTVTLSITGSADFGVGLMVAEITGAKTSGSLDAHGPGQLQTAPGTGANAVTSGTAQTNSAQPALVCGFSIDTGGTGAPAVGTGFTSGALGWGFGGANLGRFESKRITATGGQQATFTAGTSNNHLSQMAVFLEPGGGGTNTPMALSATQTQTPARARAVTKAPLAASIAQTLTRLRGVGRTLTKTQTQTTSSGPSILSGLGFTATQTQTASRVRAVGAPKASTETQTPTRLRAVSPVAKSVTQTQTASLTKGQTFFKTLTATIVQTAALVRALGLLRSVVQVQTLFRAVAIARALSALETQAKAIARAIATGRSATATQTASLAKATSRLLSLSITATQTASSSRALGRALAVTASKTLFSVRALARALNVTDGQTPSVQVVPSGGGPINYPVTIATAVTQTLALARACAKPLSSLHSQSITRARALALLANSATSVQTASVVKGQGFFKTLTATIVQTSSVLRGQAFFKFLNAVAVQTAARFLGLGSARSATQTQVANATRTLSATRTANVVQTANRGRALGVAKSANQTQTLSLVKGRGFFVTIAAVAIQVATFVKSVGLTRFATQAHALDIQSDVAGGGFPILTPAAAGYRARGRDLRSAVYTTKGRSLRS